MKIQDLADLVQAINGIDQSRVWSPEEKISLVNGLKGLLCRGVEAMTRAAAVETEEQPGPRCPKCGTDKLEQAPKTFGPRRLICENQHIFEA